MQSIFLAVTTYSVECWLLYFCGTM